MDNRANILACALDLFASRGYEGVGVQEIVDAAGITKPTLYHYFGSKQGLLEILLKTYFYELEKAVAEVTTAYKGDLPFTLRRLSKAWFKFATQNPTFYRLALALLFTPLQGEAYGVASVLHNRQYVLVETMFTQAEHDHGNMKGRHTIYAASFIGQINTCIFLWLGGHLQLNDQLVERSVHQFEHGIYS